MNKFNIINIYIYIISMTIQKEVWQTIKFNLKKLATLIIN